MQDKQQCFEELIDSNLDMLRAAAFRILGNAADVDDVIQDAMLSAWQKFSSFQNSAKLSSWVYRITINSAYEHLRGKANERKKLQNYADIQESMTDSTADDRVEQLNRAIAALPEKYRDAINIGCLSGFSSEKAADILGCSVNTLQQQLHRAREMLKNEMKGQVAV